MVDKEMSMGHIKIDSIANMQKPKKDYQYIVAIGTSTGGPKALSTVLTALAETLPATYVVVQHMPEGFTKSLAERLNQLSHLKVKEASQGDVLEQGTVYIAPGGKQLKIAGNAQHTISLTEEPAYKGHRPSVNVMYQSLAQLKTNKKVIAVIMTGMGSDGLEGITKLKETRNLQVIAQDESSCVVYGMPKAVVNAGFADYVVPIEHIAQTIQTVMGE